MFEGNEILRFFAAGWGLAVYKKAVLWYNNRRAVCMANRTGWRPFRAVHGCGIDGLAKMPLPVVLLLKKTVGFGRMQGISCGRTG